MGIISETINEKKQSPNEEGNSETNKGKKGEVEENKIRRGKKRDREISEMDKIEVIEVIAEINGVRKQGDIQNEIRSVNGGILGNEQRKTQ